MPKDKGKEFEQDLKASFPSDFYVERYKDDTAGFYGVSNPADFRLYKQPNLFLFELKSHKGKSIPFSCIRDNQVEGMEKAVKHIGVFAGFIFNFRDYAETYYIPVAMFTSYKAQVDRKSIPIEWCREHGDKIEQTLKRTRYSYDVRSFLRRYYAGT